MYGIHHTSFLMCATILLLLWSVAIAASNDGPPLIIAHRGSPCRYPEETIRGYEHAIGTGVDYIELDAISTKDGVLIARHDLILDDSTNIAELDEFQDRQSRRSAVGIKRWRRHYFAIDFNLTEIKKLRARQVLPFREQKWNDQFQIPTVAEVLETVTEARAKGQQVGAYIETKQPQFHRDRNISIEELLVKDLNDSGLLRESGAVYLQSFSLDSLKKLNTLLSDEEVSVPMTWLLSCSDELPSDEDLNEFAKFGTTLGLDKKMLTEIDYNASECHRNETKSCSAVTPTQTCIGKIHRDEDDNIPVVGIVKKARSLNLTIHTFTLRNEERFMALDFMSDPLMEIDFYMGNDIDIDGAFVDCPETYLTPNPVLMDDDDDDDDETEAARDDEEEEDNNGGELTQLSTENDEEADDEGDDDGSNANKGAWAVVISVTLLVLASLVVGLWVLYRRRSLNFARAKFTELSNQPDSSQYEL